MSTAIHRVLVVTAHPDDSEFGAGGTVAKLAREGKEITYAIVTDGSKGSRDRTMTPERLTRIRQAEQGNAARPSAWSAWSSSATWTASSRTPTTSAATSRARSAAG